jgi:hypothetical protein
LRNSRGKATKDNCCNCQVVNEKTLANERHTPIIRYIRFSQNAQISSKRLRSRSHLRIVLVRPTSYQLYRSRLVDCGLYKDRQMVDPWPLDGI